MDSGHGVYFDANIKINFKYGEIRVSIKIMTTLGGNWEGGTFQCLEVVYPSQQRRTLLCLTCASR
jgi:hypothetical protein